MLVEAGLVLETWKVGWIRMVRGSQSRTAAREIALLMGKGPMNLGASLLDPTLRGMSRVESHTFGPTL